MLKLPNSDLPAAAVADLQNRQAAINALPTYEERVAEAKRKWSTQGATFEAVKEVLDQMSSGNRRCHYCEDSAADEVEHVKPKNLYPEVVFAWTNYLYACGPCNGGKSDNYAVFRSPDRQLVSVARPRTGPAGPILPPVDGDPVFIDPRREDPMDYLMLDLRDTFRFNPVAHQDSEAYQRAQLTCKYLDLNGSERGRDYLAEGREIAYNNYLNALETYVQMKAEGNAERCARIQSAHRRMLHPTVWKEMVRQHQNIPALAVLFAMAPETLQW